jgi:U2-associated protein SR140
MQLLPLPSLLHTVTTRYRAKLEACLPEVFVSFQAAHKGADGRMVQEALRRAVLRLLRVWRDRFIFNDDYINGLQVCVCLYVSLWVGVSRGDAT